VNDLAPSEESVRASDVRRRARDLLGRDSESLSDRMFVRILKDAHDQGIIDLRRRGDDFEVARAVEAAPVSEQLARNEQATAAARTPAPTSGTPAPRIGMGPRGAGRGRPGAPPPDLFSVGVVEEAPAPPAPAPAALPVAPPSENGNAASAEEPRARGRRGRGAKKTPSPERAAPEAVHAEPPAAKAKRGREPAKKSAGRARAKKAATPTTEE